MKLGIFCNFGPPHCGGSEIVLENIATRLIDQYGYDITIYGYNYNSIFKYKSINIVPCRRGNGLIAQINENDHIFVYSDSFWGWDTIVEKIDKIDCDVSVALVGAYHMQSHPKILDLLKKNISRFNLICHSKGIDYKWCKDNELETKIIPNGVDLAEFRENRVNFREKYNIKEKYIILNVSNYFFGKGQENLPKIAKILSHDAENVEKRIGKKFRYKDFVILSISNTVKYPYDKVFLERTRKQSKGLNIRFLRDLHREDVVAAFNASDIFAFTSRKEVSPLVILESQASKTPWVSFDVGDVRDRAGGVVVKEIREKDSKGYNVIGDLEIDRFCIHTAEILESDKLIKRNKEEGQHDIEKSDWSNIVKLYSEVFGEQTVS